MAHLNRVDSKPHISRGMGTRVVLQPGVGPQGLPGPGAAAWTAAQAVTAGAVRQAPDGSWIKSTATRTTGASFDATEQTFWTAVLATTGTLEQAALSASYAAKAATTDAVVYVASTGSDANDGLSVGKPKATLAGAQTALPAAGGVIELAAGTTLSVAATTTLTKRIVLRGNGAILRASAATFDLLTLQAGASGSAIENLRIEGAATTNTTTQFGIISAAASIATAVSVTGCNFGGPDAATGLNNGVKIDTGGSDWLVTGCRFDRLIGTISGTGYGVLVGASTRCRVISNTFVGAAGQGRHAVYFSAGCTSCEASSNTVSAYNEAALAIYSTAAQPTCENNTLAGNIITGCAVNATSDSASIEIVGDAANNLVIGNLVRTSGAHGILVTDSGQGGLTARNVVRDNSVVESGRAGINAIGAKTTTIQGNYCYNNSTIAGGGTHSGIQVNSAGTFGTQVADKTWIIGNVSHGALQRHAIFVNDSAPVPTATVIKGNIVGPGTVSAIEVGTAVVTQVENTTV